jgi:hypothetical protein
MCTFIILFSSQISLEVSKSKACFVLRGNMRMLPTRAREARNVVFPTDVLVYLPI